MMMDISKIDGHFEAVKEALSKNVCKIEAGSVISTSGIRGWMGKHRMPFMEGDLLASGIGIADIDGNEFTASPSGYEFKYMNRFENKPYLCPDGSDFTRTKLEHPKGDAKYLSKFKSGIKPYILPMVHREIIDGKAEYVLVTEGEKKAVSASLLGIPVIGISGIWMWMQGEGDKSLNESLVPYLKGRKVVMIFDSDADDEKRKSSFAKCASAFSRALAEHKAELHVYVLPKNGIGKTGLDDYLLAKVRDAEDNFLENDAMTFSGCEDYVEGISDVRKGVVKELVESIKAEAKHVEPLPISLDPIGAAKAGKPFPCTDIGNAERFAYYSNGELIYDTVRGCWRRWNGKFWAEDKGSVYTVATRTVRNIRFKEAKECSDNEQSLKLARHSFASEKRSAIESMIALARFNDGIPHCTFDADNFLFNCQNGTIDLRKGELLPHSKEDFLTMCSPVKYVPDADTGRWNTYLGEVLQGDSETISFLQKAVGYSLTGDISEEHLFFIHGPEKTGKTTFLEAVKSCLGAYARTTDFETLLKKKGDSGPRNDIARLAGARLVCSCEVEEGKEMAEGIIKMLTGGDTISARFLHKEYFEFVPQFKLWIAANHAPRVSAEDGAMWRRILRIPFTYQISKGKCDNKLKPALKSPDIGGVMILRWAVEGCLKWQKEGLEIPNAVTRSTEAYRQENDYLSEFFQSQCEFDENAWTDVASLYFAYHDYCDENNIKHRFNKINFGKRMEGKGLISDVRRAGGKTTRGWKGIKLVDAVTDVTDVTQDSVNPPRGNVTETFIQNCITSVTPVTSGAKSKDATEGAKPPPEENLNASDIRQAIDKGVFPDFAYSPSNPARLPIRRSPHAPLKVPERGYLDVYGQCHICGYQWDWTGQTFCPHCFLKLHKKEVVVEEDVW